jgi:hypothetical protein
MSQQQEQSSAGEPDAGAQEGIVQQQQQAQTEGRGGQGAESAMQHLREWEQRRSGNTGGKRGH